MNEDIPRKKLEEIARRLEASGHYRVIRRLNLDELISSDNVPNTRKGMFLDVETTGLDLETCEILELAIVPFRYTIDGKIHWIGEPLHQLNEPSKPIPSEITAITGITDEAVAGHRLNVSEIEALVKDADIIIAHNAGFDRPFVEALSPIFAAKPWACTMSDVSWSSEGIEGRRLSDLLLGFGYFFDAHRAIDDCEAGVALLSMRLPRSGNTVLDTILKAARQSTWRIFAVSAPFDMKDQLKRRGYKWNADPSISPKAWWKDLQPDLVSAEINYLQTEIYKTLTNLPVYEITAFQRHSGRLR